MTRGMLAALILGGALTTGCATSSGSCRCFRPDETTELIDVKGGSCSELAAGNETFTRCEPVILINNLLGPEWQIRAEDSRTLPSFDRPWSMVGDGLR